MLTRPNLVRISDDDDEKAENVDDSSDRKTDVAINVAFQFKEQGTSLFKESKFLDASKMYRKAVDGMPVIKGYRETVRSLVRRILGLHKSSLRLREI